jgi:hypothetical protein
LFVEFFMLLLSKHDIFDSISNKYLHLITKIIKHALKVPLKFGCTQKNHGLQNILVLKFQTLVFLNLEMLKWIEARLELDASIVPLVYYNTIMQTLIRNKFCRKTSPHHQLLK